MKEKKIELKIEELEERIAPMTMHISPRGIIKAIVVVQNNHHLDGLTRGPVAHRPDIFSFE